MLLGAAFAAVLLCGASAVIVPPPTNVVVSCQNLKTTVSWQHSSQQPETRFRVTIDGSSGNSSNETTEHEYDLSHFVWRSKEHYLGFHTVTVTALQGGDQSEPTSSKSFSFNHFKTVFLKCLLEFPPVNLTVREATATLSFPNPIHFYKELEQAVKQEDAVLELSISTDKGTLEKKCIDQVDFNKTGRICARHLDDGLTAHWTIVALMLGIFLFVIVVATAAVFKVKAWTMKSYIPIPSPLVKLDTKLQWFVETPTETCSPVTVTDRSRPGSLEDVHHLSKDDGDDSDSGRSSSSLGFQSSENLYNHRQLLDGSNQELESRGHRTDEDFTDDSVKTECVSLDEEEASPYDRPQNLHDMGDGDMVICYTGS
ncbi:hypothetical protein Q5P01_025697 [Channa striata]|uniref:Fibronectin type-III domain-containing protein n=1 Tax=Channa striata TaxID=64152 RepID=A0AA88INN5_CHASR|nr:hypothetical protein Q5P01_025697 [Channa striata]